MDPVPSMFDRVFPLTVLVLLGLAIPTALLLINRFASRWAVGKRDADPGKHQQYECGLTSTVGGAGDRFPVKFYLIAMLYLAFDVEVAFLYPWAIQYTKGGWEMLWLLIAFLVLLETAYLYLWRKGALDWDSSLQRPGPCGPAGLPPGPCRGSVPSQSSGTVAASASPIVGRQHHSAPAPSLRGGAPEITGKP